MFIHIGGDKMVRLRDIIGIFDIHIKDSTNLDELFPGREKKHSVTEVQSLAGETKSVVLTSSDIYLSPISSLTLKRRAEHLYRDMEDLESFESAE